jgi:Cu-processing system ATP-binding protein
MINIVNINKAYGKVKALNNVSLQLNKGEAISLIGPNGSGKTTLIKCLLGMVIPDSGEITLENQSILSDWAYRKRIGYMPQIGRYPDNMTIGQLYDMMCDLRKISFSNSDTELVYNLGLNKILNKRMNTLSGGTRQKVSASLTFMFKPDVLVLDEPTAGLDPLSSEILKNKIVVEKENGKLVLITSHILSDLDDLVTQVIYLQDGSVLFHKSLDQLRKDTNESKLSRAIAVVMQNTMTENV